MQAVGVILAGGRATRMGGGDKGLLPLGEARLLDHVVGRLAPQVAALALNANGDGARFAAYGLPVVPDSLAGFPGPLAGVLAGLDWAAERGAELVVTAAADTPFFPRDLVERLLAMDVEAWEAFKPTVREVDAEYSQAAAAAEELHYAIRYNAFMGVRSDFFLAEEHGVEWVTAAAKPVPERLRELALAAAANEVC